MNELLRLGLIIEEELIKNGVGLEIKYINWIKNITLTQY